MSRRARSGRWAYLLLVGTAAVMPARADAQLSDQDLLRQLDSLAPLLEEAQAAAERVRQERMRERELRPRTPVDTLRIGPITVLAPPDQSELALELFTEVWREDFANVDRSPTLDRLEFAFQWRARPQQMDFGPPGEAESVRRLAISRVWSPTREAVKEHIRDAVGAALVLDFDRTLMGRWLNARSHPDGEDIYRLLVGSPGEANRQCFAGTAPACWAMLGLGLADAGPRLAEWFAPPMLARMVVDAAGVRGATLERDDPTVRACTEDGDVDACVDVLSEIDWAPTPRHADQANAHMLWLAVRMGGEGAWARALERPDATPGEVLAHVAGVSADELAGAWRASIVASRPDVHASLGTTRWAVPLWCLLLAAFAMRSTRWRLG